MGTGAAFVYSVVATIAPGLFPASAAATGHAAGVHVYFESAAVIITLVLLGQVLELKARGQTSSAIRALLGLAPKTARRIADDGNEHDVPLEQIQPGDKLRVRPGEKGAGRWRRSRWREQRGRIDDYRRADPRRQTGGR
jgi:P-type Cu+ transporter